MPLKVVTHGKATLEVVPVYINGHGPYRFLLDTGSAISSVSKRLAKTLNLPDTGSTKQVRGVVSSTRIPLVRVKRWKLGPVKLAAERIGAISISGSGTGANVIAGLLGSDELKRFGWARIDFQHQRLILGHRLRSTQAP